MAFYECTFIARADLSKADVQKLTETVSKVVTDNGGEIIKAEQWGLKNLAYKINKAGKGHYVMLGISIPGTGLAELERNLRINEDVVRYLSVKVESLDATPSVMVRAEQSGDEHDAA
jgi:small subunit ribosomal protein S6